MTARVEGNFVVLAIRDNGPGFPAEMALRAFDPTATSRRRSRSGVGLGLPVAYAVALRHHGKVVIEPAEPGACVSLWLPMRSTV